jgi:peptide-methionine (S)-S-oxide reductase
MGFMRASIVALALAVGACSAVAAIGPVPAPRVDAARASSPGKATAVVAGGCFWGIQAVYQHVRGVTRAISGYAGGTADTAQYEIVSSGTTNHAESVEITYDPSVVTYGQLLHVFFSVAHDPTELNRQGPDDGRQYRSAIFFADAEQERIARAYIAQIDEAKVFNRRLATEVVPLTKFYAAEAYHQDYATNHPGDPYIMINDAPKVRSLKKVFQDLYVEKH